MDKYPDKVKLEYHNFPLTSIHKYAYKAAEAALCAHDQGDFWGYHDMLFSYQDDLTYSDLESYAGVLDLDVEIWNDCMSTHTKKYVIEEDLDEVYRLGLNSTPTFFLNGQKIGNWGELPSLVEGLVEPLVSLENDSQDDIQE
ncbi:thioredoxin domain-containing protein [bacterium]|nr:thioredoxin domain-containing protein [bacterium]